MFSVSIGHQNHQICDQRFVEFLSQHQSCPVYFESHLDSLSALYCELVELVLITAPDNQSKFHLTHCRWLCQKTNTFISLNIGDNCNKGWYKVPPHPLKSIKSSPVFETGLTIKHSKTCKVNIGPKQDASVIVLWHGNPHTLHQLGPCFWHWRIW